MSCGQNNTVQPPVLLTNSTGNNPPGSSPVTVSQDPNTGAYSFSASTISPIIGFVINDGSTGTNVGPELRAARTGPVVECAIDIKASDPSVDLTFDIKKNNVSVFTAPQTVTHGTVGGTLILITALTSNPLTITRHDKFTIDITSGSPAWVFVAMLD